MDHLIGSTSGRTASTAVGQLLGSGMWTAAVGAELLEPTCHSRDAEVLPVPARAARPSGGGLDHLIGSNSDAQREYRGWSNPTVRRPNSSWSAVG